MTGLRDIRAAVVVLGDLGRSPRIQLHALALARAGAAVDLIGLAGTEPLPEVLVEPGIRCHSLPAGSGGSGGGGAGPLFPIRAARHVAGLARALARKLEDLSAPTHLVVQVPPAIPTLALVVRAARRYGARLVLDWHNIGADLLALKLGRGHPLTRLAGGHERRLARSGDLHLCVSEAMRGELADGWGLRPVHLFRDGPAPGFRPRGTDPRPASAEIRLVSSSSFTEDEDFSVLFDALDRHERGNGPLLHVLLTGRGARRSAWERQARLRRLVRSRVEFVWLSHRDYRIRLRMADAGLCFHQSASGLDLPMKMQDMLGSGLPVLALDYGPVIREAFAPGRDGLLFRDSEELAAALGGLREVIHTMSPGHRRSWLEAWNDDVRPLLSGLPARRAET